MKIFRGTVIMKTLILTLITGIVCGIIDVLPMIKMKLDKTAILSAFVFYLIMPFIIYNTNLFGMIWWLKGGVITLLLELPVIILVAKDGLKGVVPIGLMAIILGTLIGFAGKFLLNIL